ncbi:MAG: hypothetical protein H6557_23550 [Lewinellaceae bacterium]|nr:hypothetical protein [Lewinellaceae bacterium]
MSKFIKYAERIKNLVAGDNLEAAIDLLRGLLKDSPILNEAIVQSARLTEVEQMIRLGTVSFEQATITKNQIRMGILSLLCKIEEKAETYPGALEEVEKAVCTVQSYSSNKNAIIGSQVQARTVTIGDQHHYYGYSKGLVFLECGFSYPQPYVSRRFILISEDKPDESLTFSGLSILEKIDFHRRIVILSDAGVGKSFELLKIGYEYQQAGLRPAIIRLKNNNPLPNFILSEEDAADTENRVVLFDGLDEVNIEDASRGISNLAADYPNLRIVVSCRSNLYQNALEGFTCFPLQKFSNEEINVFLDQVIPNQKRHFLDVLPNPEIWEVFRTPFFLEKAVQYYHRNDSSLPENKIELLEFFVQASLNIRLGDISPIPEKKVLRERCRTALEKVAFVMECMGANDISQDRFTQIIPDLNEISLILRQSSLLESSGSNFQFSHRIIQEYLAAKVLSRAKSIHQIKKVVALPKAFRKIKPSWLNTLSDLLSIWEKNDKKKSRLLSWLLDSEPEVLTFFEKEKIPTGTREEIFRKVFLQHNQEKRVFDYQFFTPKDLVGLAGNRSTFRFVFKELEKATSHTCINNALTLLRYFSSHSVPSDLKESLRTTLKKQVYDFENNTPYLRHLAIECFLNFFMNDPREEPERLVDAFLDASSPDERMSAYATIRIFHLQGKYMKDLLNRMLQLDDPNWRKGNNLMDEDYHRLEQCIKELSSADDIISFFEAYSIVFQDHHSSFLDLA